MAQKVRFRDRLSHLFKKKPSSSAASSESSIVIIDAPNRDRNTTSSPATPSITASNSHHANSRAKTATSPPSAAAPAQTTTTATGQTTLVGNDPSEGRSVFGPEGVPSSNAAAGSSKEQEANKEGDEPFEFRIRVDKTFWPAFDPGESSTLSGTGTLFYDFTSGLHGQWGRGADFGPGYFGNQLFYSEKWSSGEYRVPSRLFDLVQRRVVESQEVGSRVRYAVVSHVWGRTRNIDGEKYGVDWKIPIRSEDKLEKILEAARVVIGERYIWMDVLCLDQRRKNELEIAQMKAYFGNATGCLIWLDDAFEQGNWDEILGAIKEVNKFLKLDEYSVPTVSIETMLRPNASFLEMKFTSVEALRWIGKILLIEKAPWLVNSFSDCDTRLDANITNLSGSSVCGPFRKGSFRTTCSSAHQRDT